MHVIQTPCLPRGKRNMPKTDNSCSPDSYGFAFLKFIGIQGLGCKEL